MGGIKETWMASLNDFIREQIEQIKPFFAELCNVKPLEHYFEMDSRIREKSPEDDFIFLCISDLRFLKRMLASTFKGGAVKNEDMKGQNASRAPSARDTAMFSEFCRLVRNINESDPFASSAEDKDDSASHSTFVRIAVHQYIFDEDKKKGKVKETTGYKSLQLKVVPLLQQLERRMDLLEDLTSEDFKTNLLTFLQRAQKAEKIYGIVDAISTVKSSDPSTLIELSIPTFTFSIEMHL